MNIIPTNQNQKTLCHSQEKMFEVIEIESVGTFLYVLCGGIGMYERIIRLEENEIKSFYENGEKALYSLAYQVAKGHHANREYQKK